MLILYFLYFSLTRTVASIAFRGAAIQSAFTRRRRHTRIVAAALTKTPSYIDRISWILQNPRLGLATTMVGGVWRKSWCCDKGVDSSQAVVFTMMVHYSLSLFYNYYYLYHYFNNIAIQGTPHMSEDKDAGSLSRVHSYYSKCNLPLRDSCPFCSWPY